MSEIISVDEFTQRVEDLCIGGSTGLPRRLRDLHILLASATLWMEPDAVYSEPEINAGLATWLDQGCPALDIDVTTLRRELVDRVYLNRDDSGRHYSPGPGSREFRFDADVANVDPAKVVTRAIAARKARKRAHMPKEEDR